MQISSVILLSGLVAGIAAQDLDRDDYPDRCDSVCNPVTSLTDNCDRTTDDDNDNNGQPDAESRNYINCVCNDPQRTQIPLCASCIFQFGGRNFDGDDINDIMRSCSFTSTSFIATASDSALPTSIPNSVTSAIPSITDNAGLSSISSVATSATGELGSSISSALSSASQSLSSLAATATGTPGAAAGGLKPMTGVVAVVLGVMGLM